MAQTVDSLAVDSITVDSIRVDSVAVDTIVTELHRPKIGLVLSGGGAKGLAHIGVLKAIDQAGLKIDYVTGTSMGSILGAMYAAGYSGEQIEEIARGMDWGSAMGTAVNYKQLSYEHKEEHEEFLLELPLVKWKILPPLGFIEPQELNMKFSEVFFPVYKVKDFDDLDIPFKCVATDISTGEAVVLDKGDIAFAVRSSMAIPGIFTATQLNDSVKLVDGGVVRNFPVRDIRDMGADIVIGVNLFSGLSSTEDLNNMIDITMQVMNLMDAQDLKEEKQMCDILIEPDVSNYSAASFSSSEEILAIGDTIGQVYFPQFKQLADSLHFHYDQPYAEKVRMKDYPEKVKITGFDISGLEYTDDDLLQHNLTLRVGESYSATEINEAFRAAYNSRYYSNLYYELIPVENDSVDNEVIMKCKISETAMNKLKVGLSYNTFASVAVNIGYQRNNLLGMRSQFDVKVAISESFRAFLRLRAYYGSYYNNYLDLQYAFTRYEVPIYGDKTKKKDFIYTYKHSDFCLCMAKIPLAHKDADVKFMVGYEYFRLDPQTSSDKNQVDGSISNPYLMAQCLVNNQDRRYLPRTGHNLDMALYWAIKPKYELDVSENDPNSYDRKSVYRFTFKGEFFQTPNDKKLTVIEGYGLCATYHDQNFVHQTALGGTAEFMPSHFRFWGLNTASMFTSTNAMLKFGIQYQLVSELYASLLVNGALNFKTLDAYIHDKETISFKDYLYGGGIMLSYNLPRFPFDVTLMTARHYGFNVDVKVSFFF